MENAREYYEDPYITLLDQSCHQTLEYVLLLIKRENIPPSKTKNHTHKSKRRKKGNGYKPIDMARCYRRQSQRNIVRGLSIKHHLVLSYVCNVRSRSRLLEGGLLRKIALENAGFCVVKTRKTTGPFSINSSFAHRFRTSNWLVPMDSTKSY